MFEHHRQSLLPRHIFFRRVRRNALIGVCMMLGSLSVGIIGYHHFEHLPWLDSLLNASMILSSMGPVDPVKTEGGKIFASLYALFSGIWFITVVGVVFAPVAHRFLHKFHLEMEPPGEQTKETRPHRRRSAE